MVIFAKDFILRQVKEGGNNTNIKEVAIQYGYTERRLRQILKENF